MSNKSDHGNHKDSSLGPRQVALSLGPRQVALSSIFWFKQQWVNNREITINKYCSYEIVQDIESQIFPTFPDDGKDVNYDEVNYFWKKYVESPEHIHLRIKIENDYYKHKNSIELNNDSHEDQFQIEIKRIEKEIQELHEKIKEKDEKISKSLEERKKIKNKTKENQIFINLKNELLKSEFQFPIAVFFLMNTGKYDNLDELIKYIIEKNNFYPRQFNQIENLEESIKEAIITLARTKILIEKFIFDKNLNRLEKTE